MPSQEKKGRVIALVAENENGALESHARSLNKRLFARHGYDTQLINLFSPSGLQEVSEAIDRDDIAFVYGFAGVGCQLQRPNGENLWTSAKIPFVSFWYDSPAYNYRQHAIGEPFVLHVYHVKDHYEMRQKYLPPSGQALVLPEPVGLLLNMHNWPWQERSKSILFAKTGYNPAEIEQKWRTYPPALSDLLMEVAEKGRWDVSIDLGDATADSFASRGFSTNTPDDFDDFFGVIQEVDAYLRAWRSDRLARALLKHPAKILGRGWDYLASPQNRAEILPPVPAPTLMPLIKTHRVTANANPIWRDGMHERVWFAMCCGNVALTDKTEKTDRLLGALSNYVAFNWQDNLDDVIAESLKRADDPNGYYEMAQPLLRAHVENNAFIKNLEAALAKFLIR